MANSPFRYLNLTLLKGRVGKDPDLRHMPSGDPVCNFSVATRNGKHVEWHKIVAYEGLAEYATETFRTGDFVYVEAETRTREFKTAEDKARGRKAREIRELVAKELHLLARPKGATDDEGGLPEEPAGKGEDDADNEPLRGGGLPSYI